MTAIMTAVPEIGDPARNNLPRLTYVGDVPVEASYHGSALLYRLLQSYPAGKLVVVEAGIENSKPERRIRGVRYLSIPPPLSRLQTTRFAPWYSAALLRMAIYRGGAIERIMRAQNPEAILSVSHGGSWIAAAELARRLSLPFHILCHDEWAHTGHMQRWKERVFRERYSQAVSRLCVSPYMAADFASRFGVDAITLYPARGKHNKVYDSPPRKRLADGRIVGAFAGAALHDAGNRAVLKLVSRALAGIGGRLKIFGPYDELDLTVMELADGHVQCMGLIREPELVDHLRDEADFLIAPMSFLDRDRNSVRISFPSKLTEYTAAAMPIMAVAPPYSSLAAWCRLEPAAALLVTDADLSSVRVALTQLLNAELRRDLALGATEAGGRYFAADAASNLFFSAICRGQISAKPDA